MVKFTKILLPLQPHWLAQLDFIPYLKEKCVALK
jgi:hypothetical protein